MIIDKETIFGKRIPKMDAPKKVTGETRYMDDLVLPGMLHGKILRTDRVHARILRIDTRKAESVPGVRAVITAADTPRIPLGYGKDNPPLKYEKVCCIRDEIAAVAAETEEAALEAVRRIQVEYEDIPAVFSPAEALREGAPVINPEYPDNVRFTYDYSHGDIELGEKESDLIIQDTFRLHFVTHCCMGVSGILADFDSEGYLSVYSLTQIPFLYKKDIARVVDVPPEKIRVIQPAIGGGFGSKLDIYPDEPICIFLARVTHQPVRRMFSRQDEFSSSSTRQTVEGTLRR